MFDIQSDAPGQSPSEIVSDAISKLLAGDDAHALELFDESLAGFVATVLVVPPSRAEFLAAIGQLTAPSEIAACSRALRAGRDGLDHGRKRARRGRRARVGFRSVAHPLLLSNRERTPSNLREAP